MVQEGNDELWKEVEQAGLGVDAMRAVDKEVAEGVELELGIVGGGFARALLQGGSRGGYHPTLDDGGFDALVGGSLAAKALVLAGAGVMMGYGARTAGGCTSGHGICGASLGSPASAR